MGLAGVAGQLDAITRCRIALPAPEAQHPDHEWCLTLNFAADDPVAVSFAYPPGVPGPRDLAPSFLVAGSAAFLQNQSRLA